MWLGCAFLLWTCCSSLEIMDPSPFDWVNASECGIIANYDGIAGLDPLNLWHQNSYDLTPVSPDISPIPFPQAVLSGLIYELLETPMQTHALVIVNAVASYDIPVGYRKTALDMFGSYPSDNLIPAKICPGPEIDQNDLQDNLFHLKHQKASQLLAATWHLYAEWGIPGANPGVAESDAFKDWVAQLEYLGLKDFYDEMIDPNFDHCAPENLRKPSGYGPCHMKKHYEIFWGHASGWNMRGDADRTYNRIPFSDFDYTDQEGDTYSRFDDSGCPNKVKMNPNSLKKWYPLLEDNGQGFLFRQEHVTPYIGETVRLYGLGNRTEQCELLKSKKAEKPSSQKTQAIHKVFNNTIILGNPDKSISDRAKVLVWGNDFKLRMIGRQTVDFCVNSTHTAQDGTPAPYIDEVLVGQCRAGDHASAMAAVVLSWREKVHWNEVRPTTMAEALGDEIIYSYITSEQQNGYLLAKEWQPYIRTMPHGEWPSASACICQALVDYSRTVNDGNDNLRFPGAVGAGAVPVPPGSYSRFEPGLPSNFILIAPQTFTEMRNDCGQSRLDGGMHIDESVPVSYDMCSGIGDVIAERMAKLVAGDQAGIMYYIGDDIDVCPRTNGNN